MAKIANLIKMHNKNIDDSKIKALLKDACGNHRYAILCVGLRYRAWSMPFLLF